MKRVIIAIGGNLGDSLAIFDKALLLLGGAGFLLEVRSSWWRTAAEGCGVGTADFLNGVLLGYWGGSAEELLSVCQAIEVENGRPREHGVNESRTLDLDLIWMEGVRRECVFLTLPHPRAYGRTFVMGPLSEILPEGGALREQIIKELKENEK